MRLTRRSVLLALLSGPWAVTVAHALSPRALAGRFRAADGPVRLFELRPAGGARFSVTVRFVRGETWRLECVPTDRPGVYAANTPTGTLDWLFARRRGRPLEGEPLFWARTAETEGALVLYRLVIRSDGGFALHRLALRPVDGGLVYDLRILAHDAPTRRFGGRLAP